MASKDFLRRRDLRVVLPSLMFLQLALLPTPSQASSCTPHKHRHGHDQWPSSYLPEQLRKLHWAFNAPSTSVPVASSLFDVGASVVNDAIADIRRSMMGGVAGDDASDTIRTPPYELRESPSSFTLSIDVPGSKEDQVDAQVLEENRRMILKVSAVRTRERNYHGGQRQRQKQQQQEENTQDEERIRGDADEHIEERTKDNRFELSFIIGPGVDSTRIRGTLEDGVLTLVLPKSEPEPITPPLDIPIAPPSSPTKGNSDGDGGEGDNNDGINRHPSSPINMDLDPGRLEQEEGDLKGKEGDREEDKMNEHRGGGKDSSVNANTHISLR